MPYAKRDELGKPQTGYLYFLPDLLQIEVNLEPETRSRGIFKVIVYDSQAAFRGYFAFNRLDSLGVSAEDIRWAEARISVGIPDMRGVKEKIVLQWQGVERTFASDTDPANGFFDSGASVEAPIDASNHLNQRQEFAFSLNLRGSMGFNLLPLGRTTSVTMRSSWDSPSFDGAFLPERHSFSRGGFTASWNILDMNRSYPQQWIDYIERSEISKSAFGLSLISPVDDYVNTSRAVKYAIMFLALTFLVFFMIEIFNKKRIHPIQYLLVGLALCLFYVLLLSLSEHLGFAAAYLIAGLGVVGLITYYTGSALGWKTTAPLCGTLLLALYGYLYILLKNQDYALLLGSPRSPRHSGSGDAHLPQGGLVRDRGEEARIGRGEARGGRRKSGRPSAVLRLAAGSTLAGWTAHGRS